ncbi:enoyl-CoA hydratase [Kordiimonas sediminis]|uniref:Enoyl-CoA hydratase n=1 Tax=Kordiimonas sediminis TaxID=1735581 RepID=A0A919E5S0_9PROT|nr:crotonase/enoyl-CoA hydratase family protein [Kordiimonas sediminis]GHF16754.1 enoyl-CoA hydratase [Kordiimonas sediminis]
MTYETLKTHVENGVMTVTLDRPDRLNAMNPTFFREIWQVFKSIEDDMSIRAAIICGNGKHFTAGLDLKEAAGTLSGAGDDPARVREKFLRHVKWLQETFTVVETCRVPVIAAIHGGCIGGGVDLTSCCDIRFATEDSWFCIQEINVGIVADLGTLQRVSKLMPQGIVRELAYTGRNMSAAEAAGHGFVNRILKDWDACLEAAQELAEEICRKSPLAVTGTKSVLNHARDNTVAAGLDYVATWNSGMLYGNDLMAAVTAMMSKTEAAFEDLYESED